MPNVNVPGVGYNYELVRPEEKLRANQPALRLDYQPSQNLRGTFKFSGLVAAGRAHPGHDPRLERHAAVQPVRADDRGDGQLLAQIVDVPRGHVGPRAELADRLRAGAGQHRADASAATRSR